MSEYMRPIGIFYDGGYHYKVSNYYGFEHGIGRRLGIEGLQRFVRRRVAELEGVDEPFCPVVESHYFHGRPTAAEAYERGLLYGERSFEDALIRGGLQTHYLPLVNGTEKGIDVLYALEAYERALQQRLEVVVLFAGDGDYVPLVKKLAAAGVRVMVLGFYLDHYRRVGEPVGEEIVSRTRPSPALMEQAAYPVDMSAVIEDAHQGCDDGLVDELFVSRPPGVSRRSSQGVEEGDQQDAPDGSGGEAAANGWAAGTELDDGKTIRLSGTGRVPAGDRPRSEGAIVTADGKREGEVGVVAHEREEGRIVVRKEDGYGFIRTADPEESDIFFHRRALENARFDSLGDFEIVTFLRSENDRGPCALEVRRL